MSNISLSQEEKNSYQSDLSDIHDIFKRAILIFRHAEKVIISENLNYSFAYSDMQLDNDVSGYNVASGVYYARIWHLPGLGGNPMALTTSSSSSEFTARGIPEIRFNNDKDVVRLKLDISGYDFIKGCETVQIDNSNYNVKSAYRQHGLFVPEFYTVWLEENN